ncbi:MAG TPA: hypothetical protein VMI93_11415 [Candidatus Solibacter sp.]|nr:hypothetical protein [Candidatus Solibacter sp.]
MKRGIRAAFPIFSMVVSGAALLLAGSVMAQPGPQDKPAPAQKLTGKSIQVERAQASEDLVIPEDFRVATYENLIRQIEKTGKFEHVYRSGDKRAAGQSDLVILKLVPSAYTAGSQKQREVTTIKGATSIKFTVQFTDRSGKVLLEKEVEGKVRFFGENLNATSDFAKKVGKVVNESF